MHYCFQNFFATTSANVISRTWARRTQEKSGNFKVLKIYKRERTQFGEQGWEACSVAFRFVRACQRSKYLTW